MKFLSLIVLLSANPLFATKPKSAVTNSNNNETDSTNNSNPNNNNASDNNPYLAYKQKTMNEAKSILKQIIASNSNIIPYFVWRDLFLLEGKLLATAELNLTNNIEHNDSDVIEGIRNLGSAYRSYSESCESKKVNQFIALAWAKLNQRQTYSKDEIEQAFNTSLLELQSNAAHAAGSSPNAIPPQKNKL